MGTFALTHEGNRDVGVVRRKCGCGGTCAACRERQPLRRERGRGREPGEVPPVVHEVLREPGRPLEPGLRSEMERRFGRGFGDVRVHTGAKAAESARAVNALAYTVGMDVVFGHNSYQPTLAAGKRLVAHELVHVLQQGERSDRPTAIDKDTSPFEAEANAISAATTEPSQIDVHRRSEVANRIQRQEVNQQVNQTQTDAGSGQLHYGPPTEEEWAQAGLIALGEVLQTVAAPEAGYLRDVYNQGAARIAVERARMLSQNLPEAQVAKRLSDMRHELAIEVRRAGSTLYRKGAEVFDRIRGNVGRPTYESLRAAGRTDAQIIESAARTNRFINRLPGGMRWAGRGFWIASAGISLYLIIASPPEQRGIVAQQEVEGFVGGTAGAAIGQGLCIIAGIATEGLGLILCGLLGGLAGYHAAREVGLLQLLDIAPHHVPELVGRVYRIEGDWDVSDFFLFSIVHRRVERSQNVLVVATGQRSGEKVSGRGHYRDLEVTPANAAAIQLFGSTGSRWVPGYLLRPATREDLLRSRD